MLQFLVDSVPPFRIRALPDDHNSNLLGLDVNYLKDQPVTKILGDDPVPATFANAIQETTNLQVSKMQLTIRDSTGDIRKFLITFSPHFSNRLGNCCLMTFEPSQAISLHEAFRENNRPFALISMDPPYSIHMANERFSNKFGLSIRQVLGHPLRAIQDAPDAAKFLALLQSALGGRIIRDYIITLPALEYEGAVLAPVVDGPNGRIKHILVTFTSPQACDLSAVGGGSTGAHCPGGISDVPEFAAPVVRPRRKKQTPASTGADSRPAAPVRFTMELLHTLQGLPLARAAAAAGISPTAFKKASRKLGLPRWEYRRAARTAANASQGAASALEACTDRPVPAAESEMGSAGGGVSLAGGCEQQHGAEDFLPWQSSWEGAPLDDPGFRNNWGVRAEEGGENEASPLGPADWASIAKGKPQGTTGAGVSKAAFAQALGTPQPFDGWPFGSCESNGDGDPDECLWSARVQTPAPPPQQRQ